MSTPLSDETEAVCEPLKPSVLTTLPTLAYTDAMEKQPDVLVSIDLGTTYTGMYSMRTSPSATDG